MLAVFLGEFSIYWNQYPYQSFVYSALWPSNVQCLSCIFKGVAILDLKVPIAEISFSLTLAENSPPPPPPPLEKQVHP